MPSFCRHNRLIQNCPICSREQAVELRPIVSSSTPRSSLPREHQARGAGAQPAPASRSSGARSPAGVRVRRLVRGADDGYRCSLVPGLKSSVEAERLAAELAFGATRVTVLGHAPPGLYAELAADREDVEERCWLAFLIAYISPLDSDQPFSSIEAARTPWQPPTQPGIDELALGSRTAYDPSRGSATIAAYRAWAARAGSQAAAFAGDPGWSPERRFERVFERLALPGFHRDARFDLLVTLGRTGMFDLRAAKLHLGGENDLTVAAKRALGIGDPLLLERRAAELASACELPLEALDLGLYNWGRGERATLGLGSGAQPDADLLAAARHGLRL